MSQRLMAQVAGLRLPPPVAAVLPDHCIFTVAGDVIASIAPMPGAQAQGLIWPDLPDAALARLTAYAAVFGCVLCDVTVMVGGQPRRARACLPQQAQQPTGTGWALAIWESTHLAPAILAVQELLADDPLPDAATLRALWPMIETRAWARHRARRPAPATIRHQPAAQDYAITPATPAAGGFFRFQGFDIHHARFDGTRSPVLRREVFVGVDAALLLPYDPIRDRIVLVEQVRVGPMLRGDANPWTLEPVAGIVDARETPQEAALREAMEEAALQIRTLVPAASYYPSPGPTTDYFYAFVGLCDITAQSPYTGGLDAEAEDIRLHPMDFDAAMALADSGEITTGPLLHLLYWLARHRDRLRAMG